MKEMIFLIIVGILFTNCGKKETEETASASQTQYRYTVCGTIQALPPRQLNNLAGGVNMTVFARLNLGSQIYELGEQYGNNQIRSLLQPSYAQQGCIYTNQHPNQTAGVISVEAISYEGSANGNPSTAQFPYRYCGTLQTINPNGPRIGGQGLASMNVSDYGNGPAVGLLNLQDSSNSSLVRQPLLTTYSPRQACVFGHSPPQRSIEGHHTFFVYYVQLQ